MSSTHDELSDDIPEICDFLPERELLDGDKVKIDSILNTPLVFTGWAIRPSKHKKSGAEDCLTLQFEKDGKRHVIFTGSTVLIDQITKYEQARDKTKPRKFRAVIKKIDNFYVFSST